MAAFAFYCCLRCGHLAGPSFWFKVARIVNPDGPDDIRPPDKCRHCGGEEFAGWGPKLTLGDVKPWKQLKLLIEGFRKD